MSVEGSRDRVFYGRRWMFVAGVIILGWFAVFGLIAGPAFYFGLAKPNHGGDGKPAGIGLTAGGLMAMIPALLQAYKLAALRKPVLVLSESGVEFLIIGRTSLDEIPWLPMIVRVPWAFLSRQGFRQERRTIPWDAVRGVEVRGVPTMRSLVISYLDRSNEDGPARLTVPVPQDFLKTPLDDVEAAIRTAAEEYSWGPGRD